MVPKTVKFDTLVISLASVLAIEAALRLARPVLPVPYLGILGFGRAAQILLLWSAAKRQDGDGAAIGLARKDLGPGLRWGLIWSAGFAFAAVAGLAAIHLAGFRLDQLAPARLPAGRLDAVLFFIVGGLVSPVAEEFLFRGIIYGFFRRWGVAAALIVSTAAFVLAHGSINTPPPTLIVGGMVFAAAYEIHKTLLTPIVIHVLGNMALFALAALQWYV